MAKATATTVTTVLPARTEADKDAAEFLEIIQPYVQHPEALSILATVARMFVDSLNERDAGAAELVRSALADPRLKKLMDKNRQVVIRSHEDAELAASVIQLLAEWDEQVCACTEKETAFFYKFHKTLTGRRKKLHDQLDGIIKALKGGCARWLSLEQQRVADLEKKAAEGDMAVVLDKPQINGLQARTVRKYRNVDLIGLARLCVRNKAPLEAITVQESWLQKYVELNHDRAVEIEGKPGKWLFDGTVEVVEDLQMARS